MVSLPNDNIEGVPFSTLKKIYRLMLLARKIDQKNWIFNRAGKVPFVVSAQGHEAAQAALALALDTTKDYIAPYYRDLALVLGFGMTPLEVMLSYFAKKGDPNSGGKQMPNHFSSRQLRILSGASSLSTQLNHAVGMAYAARLDGRNDIVFATGFGEGSANQAYFQDALNFASLHKLPVIFACQNNQYAISTPVSQQLATEGVAERAAAYNMPGVRVNGLDAVASYQAATQAVQRARLGKGPTLIEFMVSRLTAHSSDDNAAAYISSEELTLLKEKDPLNIFQTQLLKARVLDKESLAAMEAEIETELKKAIAQAEEADVPAPEEALTHVYEQ